MPSASITVDVKARVQHVASDASHWSIHQLGKLDRSTAVAVAKLLKEASDKGVVWLESEGALMTAERINKYLFNVLLKNLNPAVAISIDAAAAILDDFLPVPVGKTLTKVELELIASFVRGIGEGAEAYVEGKTMDKAPVTHKSLGRPRHWLTRQQKERSVSQEEEKSNPGDQASEHIPPDAILGRQAAEAEPADTRKWNMGHTFQMLQWLWSIGGQIAK